MQELTQQQVQEIIEKANVLIQVLDDARKDLLKITSIRKCENCGKYFLPLNRKDEIYCDNVYSNNKTCKEVGYDNKVNANEYLKSYRTAYKTQHAKMQRHKHIWNYKERYFEPWVTKAKENLELAQAGKITLDEFKKLLR